MAKSFAPSDYGDHRASAQRWLLLAAGTVYALGTLWVSFRSGTDTAFATISLGLLIATVGLCGMTYLRDPRVRLYIIPTLFALLYGSHVALGVAAAPAAGALRAALLLSLLAFFLVILAPTLRGFALALAISVLTGGYGALVLWPRNHAPISNAAFAGYWSPGLAVALGAALALDAARRQARGLRAELERRATSDSITGVSNRAHIKFLAHTEFARARRYREPFSCLMLEIDNYDTLAPRGPHAINAVVQVFSGYCVVVMRHCDSFGRLSPARFLALLPETPAEGAFKLANRMCADLAALDVMVAGAPLRFTVSIGAAHARAADRGAIDFMRRAEQALNDAIERGRGIAVMAEPPPAEESLNAETDALGV